MIFNCAYIVDNKASIFQYRKALGLIQQGCSRRSSVSWANTPAGGSVSLANPRRSLSLVAASKHSSKTPCAQFNSTHPHPHPARHPPPASCCGRRALRRGGARRLWHWGRRRGTRRRGGADAGGVGGGGGSKPPTGGGEA